MRVLIRTLAVLGIGAVLVALAATLVAWQLPTLQGTITLGDGDVTVHGFEGAGSAGFAFFLAGVAVVGAVIAALIAVVTAVTIGLGAAALAVAAALGAVVVALLLAASPLLLIGWLVWLALRSERPRPPLAIAAP